ncbi:MAG: TolC family protein [Candidatus Aminicenantes bacterium]|jgi:outer membrane protein TolC
MMKTAKVFAVTVLVMSLVPIALAQEELTLTLEDSIRLALSQNPTYLASEEKVEGAKSKIREAAAGFFPSLSASGLRTLKEKVFVLEFPSFIPGQPPQRVEMDFTRDYQMSLSLSVPLFLGGRLVSGVKQAKFNKLSTEESLKQSEHMTVFNTKRTFYSYLLAQEFVRVAEEAVAVAEKHLNNVKTMYEVGMASKFDLLRSEVQLANLQPQLIKAKNNVKVAELSLKTLLGVDLAQPLNIQGELTYEPYEPDLEEALTTALQMRPEIQQLKYQKMMADELLKISRGSRYPTVAITGAYNVWADEFNFKEDTWQSYYAINLAVSVPLFNGFASSAKVAQAESMIKELELNKKGLEDMILFEVRQAVLKLTEAKESLSSQEKNVEQAEESLRIAELNFSEGLATTLDVSSAQAALSQAKTNYTQALFDYVVSLAELDKAKGIGSIN